MLSFDVSSVGARGIDVVVVANYWIRKLEYGFDTMKVLLGYELPQRTDTEVTYNDET